MQHDLVDVGRQVLAKYSSKLFRRIAAAITAAPTPDPNATLATDRRGPKIRPGVFTSCECPLTLPLFGSGTTRSASLLGLLDDVDSLLGSAKGFLFGKWLADAEAWGATPSEKKLMRWNAKTQATKQGRCYHSHEP